MLASEALRNLIGSKARTIATTLFVAILTGVVAWAEYATTTDIIEFQSDYTRMGAYVAFALKEDAIDGSLCESLSDDPGVLASGGARPLSSVTPNILPESLASMAAVTPGMVNLYNPTDPFPYLPHGGYLVTRSTAEALGVEEGSWVQLVGEPATAVKIADLSDRGVSGNTGFLDIIPPTGMVNSCTAEYHPGAFPYALDHLAMVFSDAGEGVSYHVYRRPDEFTYDPISALSTRSHAQAWLPVGLTTVLIGWLSLWFRRSEFALYSALGSRRSAIALTVAIEFGLIAAIGWITGTIWSTAIFDAVHLDPLTGDQIGIAIRNTGSAVLLAAALVPLGALISRSGDVAERLKDR